MADTPGTRDAALKESYAEATKQLRLNHRQEFNDLRAKHMARLGFADWTPTLTDEEKAEQKLAELLAAHPHLAERLTQGGGGKRAASPTSDPGPTAS